MTVTWESWQWHAQTWGVFLFVKLWIWIYGVSSSADSFETLRPRVEFMPGMPCSWECETKTLRNDLFLQEKNDYFFCTESLNQDVILLATFIDGNDTMLELCLRSWNLGTCWHALPDWLTQIHAGCKRVATRRKVQTWNFKSGHILLAALAQQLPSCLQLHTEMRQNSIIRTRNQLPFWIDYQNWRRGARASIILVVAYHSNLCLWVRFQFYTMHSFNIATWGQTLNTAPFDSYITDLSGHWMKGFLCDVLQSRRGPPLTRFPESLYRERYDPRIDYIIHGLYWKESSRLIEIAWELHVLLLCFMTIDKSLLSLPDNVISLTMIWARSSLQPNGCCYKKRVSQGPWLQDFLQEVCVVSSFTTVCVLNDWSSWSSWCSIRYSLSHTLFLHFQSRAAGCVVVIVFVELWNNLPNASMLGWIWYLGVLFKLSFTVHV